MTTATNLKKNDLIFFLLIKLLIFAVRVIYYIETHLNFCLKKLENTWYGKVYMAFNSLIACNNPIYIEFSYMGIISDL